MSEVPLYPCGKGDHPQVKVSMTPVKRDKSRERSVVSLPPRV